MEEEPGAKSMAIQILEKRRHGRLSADSDDPIPTDAVRVRVGQALTTMDGSRPVPSRDPALFARPFAPLQSQQEAKLAEVKVYSHPG